MVTSGPTAITLPRHDHADDGRGVAYVPLLPGLSPDAWGEYRLGVLLRTPAAGISRSWRICGRVSGLFGRAPASTRGAGKRGHSATGSLAHRQPRVDSRPGVSRRGPVIAWVHSPGPANRQFSRDELAMGPEQCPGRGPVDIPRPESGTEGRDASGRHQCRMTQPTTGRNSHERHTSGNAGAAAAAASDHPARPACGPARDDRAVAGARAAAAVRCRAGPAGRRSAAASPTTSSATGPRWAGRYSPWESTGSTSSTSSSAGCATTTHAGSNCSTRRPPSPGNRPGGRACSRS